MNYTIAAPLAGYFQISTTEFRNLTHLPIKRFPDKGVQCLSIPRLAFRAQNILNRPGYNFIPEIKKPPWERSWKDKEEHIGIPPSKLNLFLGQPGIFDILQEAT
jgi:hypothetical protein